MNTRATRHLAGEEAPPARPALTPEQQTQIADLRALAAKKEKASQLLVEADLPEEAEPLRKAAAKALAEGEAIEALV